MCEKKRVGNKEKSVNYRSNYYSISCLNKNVCNTITVLDNEIVNIQFAFDFKYESLCSSNKHFLAAFATEESGVLKTKKYPVLLWGELCAKGRGGRLQATLRYKGTTASVSQRPILGALWVSLLRYSEQRRVRRPSARVRSVCQGGQGVHLLYNESEALVLSTPTAIAK